MKVSVILPVYNAESYVKDAVESILNQTFCDFELNIIDDGSKDNSFAILQEYAEKDNRVRLISRENRGLPRTLNELIEMSRGEYLARMDADDISASMRLEKQVAYLESNPDIVVLGTEMQIMNSNQKLFDYPYRNPEIRKIRMLFENAGVGHPTAMIRKSYLKEHNLWYNEDNVGAEDYELWSQISMAGGGIANLNEVLLQYRVHEGQITQKRDEKVEKQIARIQRKQLEGYGMQSAEDIKTLKEWNRRNLEPPYRRYYDFFVKLKCQNSKRGINACTIMRKEICYQWLKMAIHQMVYRHQIQMLAPKYICSLCKIGDWPYAYTELRKIKRMKLEQEQ